MSSEDALHLNSTDSIDADGIASKVNKSFPIKHVNGVVMGKTGAGKTTLLNTYFKRPLTLGTGVGAPQTQEITPYETDDHTLTLYDTRGIEIAQFEETFNAVKTARKTIFLILLCFISHSPCDK